MLTGPAHHPPQQARSVLSTSSSTAERSTASKQARSKPPSLPRRLLFPQLPVDADLPPLLLSPSASPELNAELYDFIAVALRAYVNPWWTKLTRYDKEFLPQITHVLTSVLRTLETRLTATDFSPLVFRDLPTLLTQHCVDYRHAQAKLHTSYASGGAASLPQLFHQMQPHMAVSAEGKVDETYIRQAVDYVLEECLPEEDYEPDPERYIIREIIVNVLLGSVVPRLTQPWFIHKTILDFLGPEDEKGQASKSSDLASETNGPPPLERQRSYHLSFQALAIFILSAIRSISTFCLALLHAYRQALGTIKKVNQSNGVFSHIPQTRDTREESPEDRVGTTAVKSTLPGSLVPMTPTTPAMIPSSVHSTESSRTSSTISASNVIAATHTPPPPPNYTQSSLQLLLTLFSPPPPPTSTSVTRHSYSTSIALTHVLSMIATLLSPFLSRLLPYLLYTHVLSSSSLAYMVRTARRALFPEGWPAPPPVDPTPEEQAVLRTDVERRLQGLVPGILKPLLGPTPDARAYTVSTMLDPLSSQACNVHLLILILDLVIVTVFPEMSVKENIVPSTNASEVDGYGHDRGGMTPPTPGSTSL